jgi:hypothetical protein
MVSIKTLSLLSVLGCAVVLPAVAEVTSSDFIGDSNSNISLWDLGDTDSDK